MRRTPSGHRAVSVLDFRGKWALPETLCSELGITGSSPFHLDRMAASQKGPRQQPGVAVWLKLQGSSSAVFMGSLEPRTTMVHPNVVFTDDQVSTLSRFRSTQAFLADATTYSWYDAWSLNKQCQLPFWLGSV